MEELAAKSDIIPAGVNRLVEFIKADELVTDEVIAWVERETEWSVMRPGDEYD